MRKSSRTFINKIVRLSAKQPWAIDRFDQIVEVLDECGDESEQELICDLITRFTYLDGSLHCAAVKQIAEKIHENWINDPVSAIVSASSADRHPDSGQLVAYELRNELVSRGWTGDRILARYDRIHKANSPPSSIVLVDEFVGSGSTFVVRLEAIRKAFAQKGWPETPVYAAAYAGMAFSVPSLLSAGFEDVYYVHALKKGISDYGVEAEVTAATASMEAIEGRLEGVVNGVELPSFGHSRCEALYWRDRGNIPNSVFPVFWWPFRRPSKKRNVVFVRA